MSLLRIKIKIEMEIVGEDPYDANLIETAARDIFRANRNDILNEAIEHNAVDITATLIHSLDDLPTGYTPRTLPWLHAVYGSKEQERTIKQIFETK